MPVENAAMRRARRWILATTLVSSMFASQAQGDCHRQGNHSTNHLPLNDSAVPIYLNELVPNTLLYINDGQARGTAFLIDRENGIFLTAAHVIEKELGSSLPVDGPKTTVWARNPKLFEGRVKLELVAIKRASQSSSAGATNGLDDFALMRLHEASLPDNAVALELALRFPEPYRDKVYVTGYGLATENDIRPRTIDQNYLPDALFDGPSHVPDAQPLYAIAANVVPGDSGGPVLLGNGNAIGFVVATQGGQQGFFQPIGRYSSEMLGSPWMWSGTLSDILFSDATIADRQTDLRSKLVPGPSGMTNLEIAANINYLLKGDLLSNIDDGLLSCPLWAATRERELGWFKSVVEVEVYRRLTAAWEPRDILVLAMGVEGVGEGNRREALAIVKAALDAQGQDDDRREPWVTLQAALLAERQDNRLEALMLYEVAQERQGEVVTARLATEAGQRAVAGVIARTVGSELANPVAEAFSMGGNFEEVLTRLSSRLAVAAPDTVVVSVEPATLERYETFRADTLSVALNDYALATTRGNDLRAAVGEDQYIDLSAQETAIRAAALAAAVSSNPRQRDRSLDTLMYSARGLTYDVVAAELANVHLGGEDSFLLNVGAGFGRGTIGDM